MEEARSGQESPENVISKECLNVGDIITYIPIEYCQCFGNKQFIIQSTVLSVDPEAEENDKLKLVSGDRIEDRQIMYRSQINYKGKLIKHPGRIRHLNEYRLTPQVQHRDNSCG